MPTARRRMVRAFSFHPLTCAALASMALSSHGARAQSNAAAAPALETITVTAERRLGQLDTTPAAVTALSGARLAEQGVSGLADVATLVPNMAFTTGYGNASQIFIRGVGNVFFNAGGDAGVAVYADGAYVSDQTSSNMSLFDVQRIEVLRGPQGALYGRNATGGAVNIISAQPGNRFAARAGLLVGNYGRRESEGFVTAPWSAEGAGGGWRLSYQARSLDGYTANALAGQTGAPVLAGNPSTVGPERLDDLGSRALRMQGLWALGAGSLRLVLGHQRQSEAGASNGLLVEPTPMVSQLLFNATPSRDPRVVKSTGASNRVEANTAQGIVEQPLGELTLKVVASARKSRADSAWDGDVTEAPVATTRFTTGSRDLGLDAQLANDGSGALQWLVGASVQRFNQRQDIRVDTQIPLGFLVPGQPVTVPFPGGVQFLLGGDLVSRASSLYADLRYALAPSLTLLAGVRSAHERKSAAEYQRVLAFGIDGAASPRASWSSTPASVGLEWNFSKETLAYGKFSRGFKSGAINVGSLQGTVRPETVSAVELGLKSSFWERRASLGLAVFDNRYRDMQVSQVGLASAVLANASAAKIRGLEIEAALRPVRELTLNASLGLMDPSYTDFVNTNQRTGGPAVNVRGNQLAQVSKVQASAGGEWAGQVAGWATTLRAEYVWRSKLFFTEFNTDDASQAAYGMANLSFSTGPSGAMWKIQGWVRNLGNTTALTSMNIASPVLGGARQVSYTPPRHFGVGAQFSF